MNSTNKKSPGARGIPRPFNRQEKRAPQFKPVVAQLKTDVLAQSVKRPVAPPVYRPQSTPKVLQTKSAPAQSPQAGQASRPPVAPPVYRPEAKKAIQPKALTQQRKTPTAPPVYRPEQQRIAQPKMASTALAHTLPKAPPVYHPQVKQVNAQPGLPAQMKSKMASSPFSPPRATPAIVVQRTALAQQPTLASLRVHWRGSTVIQRIEKRLATGGTIDVEELDVDVWASRMLDDKPATLKIWKRTGTNPVSYNGDTFYSEDDETLHPLTAADVNAYWDEKYSGFERSGSPTPLLNCEDYAKGGTGVEYRDGDTYNLNNEADQDKLKGVLDAGKHVLQLGAVKLTAHFLIAEKEGGNVKISQKDGDSAYYQKAMSAAEAVNYIRGKHSTVVEVHPA
jgi:hypothetical protein